MDIKATKDNADIILVLAETKRIAENLTKKEMCHILDINDNFYIGCVTGRAKASVLLLEALIKYINMKTQDVYFKVFAFRSSPTFIGKKDEKKFMAVGDNMWKERYNKKMAHFEPEFATLVEKLEQTNVLRVPM